MTRLCRLTAAFQPRRLRMAPARRGCKRLLAGEPRPKDRGMVRRDEVDSTSSASRCSSPAGASPASVSAGAPSSRPQASGEIPVARAGCQEPLRREPVRGPQHQVKPAASTQLQPESRAAHFSAKAMSRVPQSGGTRADEVSAGYRAQHVDRERTEHERPVCAARVGARARISRRRSRVRCSGRPRGP